MLPKSLHQTALKSLHDDVGHFGKDKTVDWYSSSSTDQVYHQQWKHTATRIAIVVSISFGWLVSLVG